MLQHLNTKKIILASKSPRRQELLKGLGIQFEIQTREVDEDFSSHLKAQEIPLYLAEKKAKAFSDIAAENTIVITADTIVWVDDQVLNKPQDTEDAVRMLKLLSGKKHTVYTGVAIMNNQKIHSVFDATDVYFRTLSEEEIRYYIKTCQPFDKAGSYGVQEWIGYTGIEKISGCLYNVMGLPLRLVYRELNNLK